MEFEDKETCQMHDLMHDLAQMVGDECQLVDSPSEYVNENIRHVRIVDNCQAVLRSPSLSNTPSHLRSYVKFGARVRYHLPKSEFDGNISSFEGIACIILERQML
uniref:Uncharacterized protein n=1 Tax=Opuntia streptacantha TaxID=393608 RepID=A0A7C8YDG1_OPUST